MYPRGVLIAYKDKWFGCLSKAWSNTSANPAPGLLFFFFCYTQFGSFDNVMRNTTNELYLFTHVHTYKCGVLYKQLC